LQAKNNGLKKNWWRMPPLLSLNYKYEDERY